MTEYPGRAAQLRGIIEGESTEPVDSPLGEIGYLPALTGDTVKAGGQARRVAVYDVDIAHRDTELEPLTIHSAKAGDVVTVTQAQADRLEAAGFLMGEAEYKAATTARKSTRKA